MAARFLIALCAGHATGAMAHQGSMSMWASTKDTLVGYKSEGSNCKFADKKMGGLNAATAQTPYIKSRKYCAVNAAMFGGGEICGACFRITYKGNHAQHLGRPGSTVIQVVDSGSWATFDCHMNAFSDVTDYHTGIFPVTYEQVSCDTTSAGATVAVLESDYYFTKLVFNNLHYPVKEASVAVAGRDYPLQLVSGWWYVWTGGVKGHSEFSVTETNGQKVRIPGCFGGWQHRHGGACTVSGQRAFAAVETSLAAVATANATDNMTIDITSATPRPTPALATAPVQPATAATATTALRGAAAAPPIAAEASGSTSGAQEQVKAATTKKPEAVLLP